MTYTSDSELRCASWVYLRIEVVSGGGTYVKILLGSHSLRHSTLAVVQPTVPGVTEKVYLGISLNDGKAGIGELNQT